MNNSLAYKEDIWEELINGQTVLMSPRPTWSHISTAANIFYIFRKFLFGRKCTPIPDGMEVYLDEENHFIPDMMVVCDPEQVGGDSVHGAPDLVVEVLSPTTAKHDRGRKKDAYERNGVREYWLVEPVSKMVEQYVLQEGQLRLHEVYAVHPEVMLAKMTEQERLAVKKEFRCSLYEDLSIRLEDIFRRVP